MGSWDRVGRMIGGGCCFCFERSLTSLFGVGRWMSPTRISLEWMTELDAVRTNA